MTDEQCVALTAAILATADPAKKLGWADSYASQATRLWDAVRRLRAAQFNGANDPKEA